MQTITEDKLLKLKSGTDIRGVAVKTENEEIELTDEVVKRICAAFVRWFRKRENRQNVRIAVGHDSRISADRIKNAAIEAFTSEGADVYDCSLSSTPAMFMTLILDIKADASLEITASHHPYQRNGLKFFTRDGGLEGSELSEILSDAAKNLIGSKRGRVTEYDFMSVYCAHLRKMITDGADDGEKPLSGLKIAVDAGNGVGGFFALNVLAPLGADVSASRYLEPDGMFPNHIPNPENKQAVVSACDMVKSSGADFGFIFDTDVDRMGCVSASGEEINRNRLVALACAVTLDGGTAVTDSLTSDGLREFIEKDLGGKQLRFKRGYKNVIDKAKELNAVGINAPLAIETSGHAALKENYFLDDGAYLAAKFVILLARLRKQGKSVDDLIKNLKEPAESVEIRIPILLDDFKAYGESVIAALTEYAELREGWEVEKENYEGVRINVSGGWFLLRLSVHDPILPLNIENDNMGVCSEIADELKKFLSSYDKLDLKNFD